MERIVDIMKSFVSEHITYENMKKNMDEFIDYQNNSGLSFAKLVLIHHEVFCKDKNNSHQFEILKLAAAVEIAVLAIDIFDDIADKDNTDVPWMNISSSLAIHIGTSLMLVAKKVIGSCNLTVKPKLVEIFDDCLINTSIGQYEDSENCICTEARYLKVTAGKSGSLIALACLFGALPNNPFVMRSVAEYSTQLGIVAQINNDIKDIQSNTSKNDLINKKKTLPTLFLLNFKDEKFQLIQDYYKGKISRAELTSNRELILDNVKKSGAVEYAKVIRELESQKGKSIIESMNLSTGEKNKLKALFH